MSNKKIVLASDHAGFKHKESIKKYLIEKGYKVEDVGAFEYVEGDDYPEYMAKAAVKIATEPDEFAKAIIFGGSGQGEAMTANRFPGARAAVWYGGNADILKLSREHNDANILSIGARFVSEDEAKNAVSLWLETPFGGEEKHARRIEEMDSIE